MDEPSNDEQQSQELPVETLPLQPEVMNFAGTSNTTADAATSTVGSSTSSTSSRGRSGRSLLDRIRAQHSKLSSTSSSGSTNSQRQRQQHDENAPVTLISTEHYHQPTIPQYQPIPQAPPLSSQQQVDDGSSYYERAQAYFASNPFTTNNFNFGASSMGGWMNGGTSRIPNLDSDDMEVSLLTPTRDNPYYYDGTGEYSIVKYFMTFVMDIYNLFTKLPTPVRWVVVIFLLYVVFKLL